MSTKSGCAPAWEMASAVAMKVLGTVTTMSPGATPAAISANRSASVPLPTPMQCFVSVNFAKSSSNFSTIGPPTNPAVSSAALKTDTSSSSSSRCCMMRSTSGIFTGVRSSRHLRAVDRPQHTRRVSDDDRVGGHVARDHAAGPDQGVLADRDVGENRRAGTDGRALADPRQLDTPVLLGLQPTAWSSGSPARIVNERHPMADEDGVLDGDAFAG